MPTNKENHIASYNKKTYLPVLFRIPKKEEGVIFRLSNAPSKNGHILKLIKNIRPAVLKLSIIKAP